MNKTVNKLLLSKTMSNNQLSFSSQRSVSSEQNKIKILLRKKSCIKNQIDCQAKIEQQKVIKCQTQQIQARKFKIKSQRLNRQQKNAKGIKDRCATMPDCCYMNRKKKSINVKQSESKCLSKCSKPTQYHSKKHSTVSKTNDEFIVTKKQNAKKIKQKSMKQSTFIKNSKNIKSKPSVLKSSIKGQDFVYNKYKNRNAHKLIVLSDLKLVKSLIDYSEMPSNSSRKYQSSHMDINQKYFKISHDNTSDLRQIVKMENDRQINNQKQTLNYLNIIASKQYEQFKQKYFVSVVKIQNWWRKYYSRNLICNYRKIFASATKNHQNIKKKNKQINNKEINKNCQGKAEIIKTRKFFNEQNIGSSGQNSLIHITSSPSQSKCLQNCICCFCKYEQKNNPIIKLIKIKSNKSLTISQPNQSSYRQLTSQIQCQSVQNKKTHLQNLYGKYQKNHINYQQQQQQNAQNEFMSLIQVNFENDNNSWKLAEQNTIINKKLTNINIEDHNEQMGVDQPLSQIFAQGQLSLDSPISQMFEYRRNFQIKQSKSMQINDRLIDQIFEYMLQQFVVQIKDMIKKLTKIKNYCEQHDQNSGMYYQQYINRVSQLHIKQNKQYIAYLGMLMQQIVENSDTLKYIQQKIIANRRRQTIFINKYMNNRIQQMYDFMIPQSCHAQARDITISLCLNQHKYNDDNYQIVSKQCILLCLYHTMQQLLETCVSSLSIYAPTSSHNLPMIQQLLQLCVQQTMQISNLHVDLFDQRMTVDLTHWVYADRLKNCYWGHQNQQHIGKILHELSQCIMNVLFHQLQVDILALNK